MHQPLFLGPRASRARLALTACACALTAVSIGAAGHHPELWLTPDQAAKAPTQQSGVPPLIDRELLFGSKLAK